VQRETLSNEPASDRIVALEAALSAERVRTTELTAERDRLRKAYRELQLELELLRRRIFVANAERVDSSQLQLEFAAKLAELDALAGVVPESVKGKASDPEDPEDPSATPKPKLKRKPTGRRDLLKLDLPEERVELVDPDLEGKAPRIGFEESAKLVWRRGGFVRLVVARVKYRVETSPAETTIVTAPLPAETFARALAAPSLMAHIINDKFCDGLPLHRQEERFTRDGVDLDRSTMSRWVEDAGATLGATVVEAMRNEAMKTAFCLATDATGVAVQPEATADKKRQPCRRGHYFVLLADLDHVFFEYVARETSEAVSRMFRGFTGYVQADAKSVYDVLFVLPAARLPFDDEAEPDLAVRQEVGCWAHARRKFWEAAAAKNVVAREALVRIQRMFLLERDWKGQPPAKIKLLRQAHSRPHLVALFAWAQLEYEKVKGERGMLRSALGYLVRQREALMRFLEDGRLRPDNNASERALRRVAVGRKAWLFVGSDVHAEAAGHLMSLIASAKLHGLHPEVYLRDVLRVVTDQ
jgi:transposase